MTKLVFPSPEFDETVAAVCDGFATEQQTQELHELLQSDARACDEYLLRVELHARLATSPEFFLPSPLEDGVVVAAPLLAPQSHGQLSPPVTRVDLRRYYSWAAITACAFLMAWFSWLAWNQNRNQEEVNSGKPLQGQVTHAVAMLNRVVNARWQSEGMVPQPESPLEPGVLKLEAGLAEIVFYNGARVILEGPCHLDIVSASVAVCSRGRVSLEVPEQPHDFEMRTPHLSARAVEGACGLEVRAEETELHVFKGQVRLSLAADGTSIDLSESQGEVVAQSGVRRSISADSQSFQSLFDLRSRSTAAAETRFDEWLSTNDQLRSDPSLLVYFDFEHDGLDEWQLSNTSRRNSDSPRATIVGCTWGQGRWSQKRAIEFRSVNDRVRLHVPGRYPSLTLTCWVRIQGLDRHFNSLLMCDGFQPQSLHWLIRNDGVLGLTVVGRQPDMFQIVASAPVVALDHFGRWIHLAVVVDGDARRVKHYFNGTLVSDDELRVPPDFQIGSAQLGNWDAAGFPGPDALVQRNFSGAMDEFCLFSRALLPQEIMDLFEAGTPVPLPNGGAR